MNFRKRGFRAMVLGLLVAGGLALAPAAFAGGHVSVGVNLPGVSIGYGGHSGYVGVYAPAYYGAAYYPSTYYYDYGPAYYSTYYAPYPAYYGSYYYYGGHRYYRSHHHDRYYGHGGYDRHDSYYYHHH